MADTRIRGEMEAVVVAVRGRVLDVAVFAAREDAERFGNHVRRWAFGKGIRADVWRLAVEASPQTRRWAEEAALAAAG